MTKVNLSAAYLRYLYPKGLAVVNYNVGDSGSRDFFIEPRNVELSPEDSSVLIGRFTTEQIIENLDKELVLGMWMGVIKNQTTTLRKLITYELSNKPYRPRR